MAAPEIFKLPSELHCNIANHLDKEDARSFRLCCKVLHTAATQALFSFVRLYPCDESVARYNAILEHPEINKWVRHVELNTREDEGEDRDDEPDLSNETKVAFASFPKFANLTSVALRFSPNATSNSWYGHYHGVGWSDWPQDYKFRQPLLQSFFRTLAEPEASRISRICIDNIQNMNDIKGEFMQSDSVVKVLSRLRALQLFITTEDSEAAPENNLQMIELHTFMAELPSLWLKPAANNLTTLVLYQTFYFGYSPKLDLRGVHFPNLRTLALGNYVFTHNWQLDWLTSHTKLESLYLDDCITLYYAHLINFPLDEDGYPQILTLPNKTTSNQGTARGGTGTRTHHFIDMPWSKIFNHISSHLLSSSPSSSPFKSLVKFRIGTSPRWERRRRGLFDRLDYEQTPIRLNADRYQIFDTGIGPYQYTDEITRRAGPHASAVGNFDLSFGRREKTPNADAQQVGEQVRRFLSRWEEQQEEDKQALLKLLRVMKAKHDPSAVVEDSVVVGLVAKSMGDDGWEDDEEVEFPTSY